MKNTITEIKNTLEVINSKITEAEEWICELQNGMVEMTAVEQKNQKRMKRIEDSLRNIWDNIKHTNIWISGAPGKKIEMFRENIWRDQSQNLS